MLHDPGCRGSAWSWRHEPTSNSARGRVGKLPAKPDTLPTIRTFLSHRRGPDGHPLSSKLCSAEVWGSGWVRFRLMSHEEEREERTQGCHTQQAWHGSRIEALYTNLYDGELETPPENSRDWAPRSFRRHIAASNTIPHFYKDWDQAEQTEMTWVELRDDDVYFGIMFEALVDCRRQDRTPGHIWPRSDRWAQPAGTYRLVALWVCGCHASELPPRPFTIGLPWKPEREVPPHKQCFDLKVNVLPPPDKSNGQDHTGQSCPKWFPPATPAPWGTSSHQGAPATNAIASAPSPWPSPLPCCVVRGPLCPDTPSSRSQGTSSPANLRQQDTALCSPPARKQRQSHVERPLVEKPPVKQPPGWPPDVWPPQGTMATSHQAPTFKNPPPWPACWPWKKDLPDSQFRFGSRQRSGSEGRPGSQDGGSSNQGNSPGHAGTGGTGGGRYGNSVSSGTDTSGNAQELTYLHLYRLRAAQGSATSSDSMSESGMPSLTDTPSARVPSSASSVTAGDLSRPVEDGTAAKATVEEGASYQPLTHLARHSDVQIREGVECCCGYQVVTASSTQPRTEISLQATQPNTPLTNQLFGIAATQKSWRNHEIDQQCLAADAMFHISFVNPSCTKESYSMVAPASQKTCLAQALAATDTADLAKHDRWHRVAKEALLHLMQYEWEAILELKGRQSGRLEVEKYCKWCASCMHPFYRLAKCRRCDRLLCKVCLTEDGKCYDTSFCRQVPCTWRAAIRVLENSDHEIFQKWLEAARLLNACAEHIGWGSLPRLDHKPEVAHAKPNHTNTLAK